MQTLISSFILNGHKNIEIPSIAEIQKILVTLGQTNETLLEKNKIINLDDLGMVFSYLIDTRIDIINFKNLLQFYEYLKDIILYFKSNDFPILLSNNMNSIYTIIGVENNSSERDSKILVLNHSYSRNNSLFKLSKSGACKWINLSEFFLIDESIEILIVNSKIIY